MREIAIAECINGAGSSNGLHGILEVNPITSYTLPNIELKYHVTS